MFFSVDVVIAVVDVDAAVVADDVALCSHSLLLLGLHPLDHLSVLMMGSWEEPRSRCHHQSLDSRTQSGS